jgi:hypothetical protein
VLYRHDALLHAVATDPSRQAPETLAHHQAKQAEGMTKHLTDEHHPSLVEEVWELRRMLERMPSQLYLQCVAMHQLVWQVSEETVNYFAQRRPRDLGKFEWLVDAKDSTRITSQEKWRHEVIGPMGESRSRREPFWIVRDKGFNTSHFDRAFSIEKELWQPDRAEQDPDQPREQVPGIDLKKLIIDRLSFVDSKSELLIQAVDVLTGFVRRALQSRTVDQDALSSLGRLMIRRKRNGVPQTIRLITLGQEQDVPRFIDARIRAIASTARSMIKPEPKLSHGRRKS